MMRSQMPRTCWRFRTNISSAILMLRTPYWLTSRSICSMTRVGAPVAVAVGRLAARPPACFAALERRLDAAERAVVGAAERGVERGVGLAVAGRRGSASCGRGSGPSAAGPRRRRASRRPGRRPAAGPACRQRPAVLRDTTGRAPAPKSGAGVFRASTRSTSVCSPSPAATKSASSSRSVRSGRAATWPPTSRTGCSGVSCLIAVQTWPAAVMICVEADG